MKAGYMSGNTASWYDYWIYSSSIGGISNYNVSDYHILTGSTNSDIWIYKGDHYYPYADGV